MAIISSCFSASFASNYDFEADGIYYKIISAANLTAGVVGVTDNNIKTLNIPTSVYFKSKQLNVIKIEGLSSLESLEEVKIPNSVHIIGDRAFRFCTSLESINIPNSIRTIGEWTFAGCTSLESINIPNSITTIGEYAFSDCTSLKNINIPNSITTIEEYAFSNCTSLKNINIPNSVKTIADYTFENCI